MSFVQPACHSYSLHVIRTACVSFVHPACHSYSLCVIRTACMSFVQPVCHSFTLHVIRTGGVNGRVSSLTETGWLMPAATLPGLVHACGQTARAGSCLWPHCPGWFMLVATLPGLVNACGHTAQAGSCLWPHCPGWFMPVATLPGLPTLWQLEAGKTKWKDGVTTVTACAVCTGNDG